MSSCGSVTKIADKVQKTSTPTDLSSVIDIEKDTPPSKKLKLKQINLMQSFKLSVSNTNKAGVTTLLSPGIVVDSEEQANLRCDKCSETFTSHSNLSRHKVNNCRGLQPSVNTYRPRYAYNRGQNTRQSYTNKQKMAAVLFYNTFPEGTEGIATEYNKVSGIPVDTIRKWLNTVEARIAITTEWIRDPNGRRGGLRAKGTVAKGQFYAAEQRLFAAILVRRKRGRRVQPLFVSRTGDGDKRMCTLQVCIRAEGSQPPITIIFRGADAKYYKNERAHYHDKFMCSIKRKLGLINLLLKLGTAKYFILILIRAQQLRADRHRRFCSVTIWIPKYMSSS